ncbi:MAG TPA: hypothetical protein CFH84_01135 [Sulfurimonas sp. UBA12504]|nr:MAG: hypothetical protein A2019_02710 [Sulfurimonas sp. GWF2_37_8]DAB30972.1 MAG TPA: hypothetical protein CFH84_01135 [Sulfurimonas sp. UBA12504]
MKTLAKLLFVALLGAGTLHAAAFEKVANSNATHVTLTAEKPLTTGSNTIMLVIGDEKLSDAQVSIKVFMPAMPGMAHMEEMSEAKNLGGGKYETEVNFSMPGTWQMQILITPKEGKAIRVKTSFNI